MGNYLKGESFCRFLYTAYSLVRIVKKFTRYHPGFNWYRKLVRRKNKPFLYNSKLFKASQTDSFFKPAGYAHPTD